ncbi:alpha/beta fold hydrolase [Parenemella sanctibonifatiensis]|uniref:AB hydrolase-1 domain-containing protein n=1 Tax=Parenemella sanctibonifatiensis TaxID=2016505 RepID=A0A255E6T1_9ACTN|nr:alpha/beta fold hydrolase [Parenemella sanctibonifatiensis]OYN86661.1 hypothetical protein CGZ92_10090 [Parenemella sanctibonifatiensis]
MIFDLFGVLANAEVSAPGADLAVLEGIPDAPTAAVLLVHGYCGSKEDFSFLIPELVGRGIAGFSYDQRGWYQSRSDGPFDLASSVDDLAAVTAYARQRVGDGVPLHLVGHSFGGLIAQRAVIAQPQAYASLTLLCSGPAGLGVDPHPNNQITRDRLNQFVEAMNRTEDMEAIWRERSAVEGIDPDVGLGKFLTERFVAGRHDALLATTEALWHAPDVIDQVAATGVPAHVIFGERDGTWAQVTQRQTAERLGTEVDVIPEAMHNPQLENVDALADVLAQRLAQPTPN